MVSTAFETDRVPEPEAELPRLVSVLWVLPLVAALSFRLIVVWTCGPRVLSTLTPDDAYYYFGVARSLSAGLGSTFDGVTATNGYQPLWLLLCTCLARVLGVDPADPGSYAVLPRAAVTLQVTLATTGLWVLARAARTAVAKRRAGAVVWLAACNPWTVYTMCDGMEGGLVMLGVALVCHALASGKPMRSLATAEQLCLGLALSLVCLSRLDMLLLVPLACYQVWRSPAGLRGALWVGVLPTLTLTIYLTVNACYFDTLLPISAWLKDSFPAVAGQGWRWLEQYPIQFGVACAAVTVACCTLRTRSLSAGAAACLRVAASALVLHAIHTLLFMRGDVWKWHFASYWPLALFVLACVRAPLRVSVRGLAASAAVMFTMQAMGEWAYFRHRSQRAFMTALFDTAERLRSSVSSGALLAMSDAGVLGYYRGGHVLVLDGLVLNRAYQEALAKGGFGRYLRERNVAYLAQRFEGPDGLTPGYSHHELVQDSMLGKELEGRLLVHEQDEVLRLPYIDQDGRLLRTLIVWRAPWAVRVKDSRARD